MSANAVLVACGALICLIGAYLMALAEPVQRKAAAQRAQQSIEDREARGNLDLRFVGW